MRTGTILMLTIASISLTACSLMTGNVIPNKGPSMEHIYDVMGKDNEKKDQQVNDDRNDDVEAANNISSSNLSEIRQQFNTAASDNTRSLSANVNRYAVSQEFKKLPNPELHLFIFPHLAGQDQIPVPGYFTAFNAYERDHYALPNEMVRG